MKHYIILILILISHALPAQNESIVFDKNTLLNKGIYTCFSELLSNSPKYPGCEMDVTNHPIYFQPIRYYLNQNKIKQEYQDSIFAVVKDKMLYVYYKHEFCNLILKGAISTFFSINYKLKIDPENYKNGRPFYTWGENNTLYFIDLKTGIIDELNVENMDKIFKHDRDLYSEFTSISYHKRKKTLYSFVLKYNQRHPLYIKPN